MTRANRLLVASWGYPHNWKQCNYMVQVGDRMEEPYPARTTTDPLDKALAPDKIIIIAPDTSLHNPPQNITSYEELITSIQDEFLDWINKHTSIDKSRIRLRVAPNVGVYRHVESSIVGAAGTPYGNYGYHLLASILSEISWLDGDLELVLDITHGINFMPTALFRTGIMLGQAYSMAKHARVTLRIYNSTPPPPGPAECGTLTVYEVARIHFQPATSIYGLAQSIIEAKAGDRGIKTKLSAIVTDRNVEESKKVSGLLYKMEEIKSINSIINSLDTVAGVILSGAPLAAVLVASEYKDRGLAQLSGLLEALASYLRQHGVRVEGSTNRVSVRWIATPSLEAAIAATVSASFHEHIARAVEKALGKVPDPRLVTDKGLSLKELRNISDSLVSPNKMVVSNELGEEKLEYIPTSCKCAVELNPRNFYAHAGLIRGLALRQGDRVLYCPDMKDRVYELLKSVTNQILYNVK